MLKVQLCIHLILFCAFAKPSQGKEKLCFSESYSGQCDGDDEACVQSCNDDKLSGGKCGAFKSSRVCYCEGCHQSVTDRNRTPAPKMPSQGKEELCISQSYPLGQCDGDDKACVQSCNDDKLSGGKCGAYRSTRVCYCEGCHQGVTVETPGERKANHGGFLVLAQGPSLWKLPGEDVNETKELSSFSIEVNEEVAVDCINHYLYWTIYGKGIRRSRYDGSDNHLVVTSGEIYYGLAVDFVAGNMFWVQNSAILVAKMSNLEAGHKTIISHTGMDNYGGLAVHPSRGSIYWSHSNTIESISMDGSNHQVLVTGAHALSLALDYEANDLYWTDQSTGNIECISLNGGGKRIVSAQGSAGKDSWGISLSGERVYWTSFTNKTVNSITKSGLAMKHHSLPVGRSEFLIGIVFVPEQCPKLSNACAVSNGGCPFICLPLPDNNKKCVCPDGNSSCTS
ncbi:putative Low-density lipoprotein receptor-related protein 4 [Hypsibius exemplaris]|uniref:Low-density lipoprotein receptor-related protein 4 n=1 Tax=Hypsibius exemplaris TaxID=2072580 RepID=A0A1W0WW45_HYPEX|nr:putative Low-density lipoprotein receptor-related protein 4 [Hypsibius exemplaris]